jgi:hypothetical protein
VSGTLARYRDALERLFPGEAHAGS